MNRRGVETAVVKILFITITLVLAAVAIKMSYDAYAASKVSVNITGSAKEPIEAIKNLTAAISGEV